MPGHDIVVIGASAGGVETLRQLVAALPQDLPAAVFVVMHLPANGVSALPQILGRAGALPVVHPVEGDPILPGWIYVAPPDHHLLLRPGRIRLARGPRENGVRPAADPLFRTAARAYRGRVIGVVLSGTLDDGTAGLAVVKDCGGIAVVQDPNDALFAGMPRSALEHVAVDHCVPVDAMGDLLVRLTREPAVLEHGEMDENLEIEADIAELEPGALVKQDRPGLPSVFTCPECHGTLYEIHEGKMERYRCRVGHAYSPDSLMADQGEALEAALWTALRALEERTALALRLQERSSVNGHHLAADRFGEQVRSAQEGAERIREVLLSGRSMDTGPADKENQF